MRRLQETNKNRTKTRRANLRRRQVGRGSRSKSRLQHQANDEQMNSLRKMGQDWLFVLWLQQWGSEKKHTKKVLPPQLLSFFPSLQNQFTQQISLTTTSSSYTWPQIPRPKFEETKFFLLLVNGRGLPQMLQRHVKQEVVVRIQGFKRFHTLMIDPWKTTAERKIGFRVDRYLLPRWDFPKA